MNVRSLTGHFAGQHLVNPFLDIEARVDNDEDEEDEEGNDGEPVGVPDL